MATRRRATATGALACLTLGVLSMACSGSDRDRPTGGPSGGAVAGSSGGVSTGGGSTTGSSSSTGTGGASGCYDGPVTVESYTDVATFDTEVAGAVRTIDFDDISVAGTPVPFDADRYLASTGALIEGQNGQFVSTDFGFPADYLPSSAPNSYAPGPAILDGGGFQTDVTFFVGSAPACVSGFGAVFIDADFPGIAASSIAVRDVNGIALGQEAGFSGASGSQLFRGLVTVDASGTPVPAIASVRLVNGDVWPESSCCEGVTLDDFRFDEPVAK